MSSHKPVQTRLRSRRSRYLTATLAIALSLPIGVLAASSEASAAPPSTFLVNDTTDAALVNPSGTTCVSTNAGSCTLRSAVQAADNLGGNVSISLPVGLYKITIPSTGSNDPSTGDLDINNGVSLTVTGGGSSSTIIDGNSLDRAFAVQSGASLALSGVTIQHGAMSKNNASVADTSPYNGGAIYNDGTLSVDSSVLTSNSAYDDGGAIYTDSDAVSTTITNTTATYNSSDDPGGFLYAYEGSSSITFVNDTITNNSATYDAGGALYDTSTGPVSITNSTISNNIAGDDSGGGLYLDDAGSLTITGSTLNSNSSDSNEGGAIYDNGSGPISVTGSTLSGNTTGGDDGGAIYASDDSTLTVSGSTFAHDNAGDSNGGAIYLSNTDLTVSGSTFTANKGAEGGAVYVDGTTGTAVQSVTSSTFANNAATGYEGGAIYDDSGALQVSGSTFSGNTSSYYGGALSYESGDGLALTNDTFDGNAAAYEGGALYLDSSASTGTINLLNDTITRNTAYEGGGITNPGYTDSIQNTIVAGNFGGVSSSGGGDCYQNSLTDNAGGSDGGGNIDSDGTCFSSGAGSITNADPKLFPLIANGGATLTDALASGSPAIGAAVSGTCPSTDQRGTARPVACDSGAYQTQGPAASLTATSAALPASPTFLVNDTTDAPLANPSGTTCVSTHAGSCTLRAAVQAADNLGGSVSINVPAGLYGITITSTGADDPSTGDFDVWSGTYLTVNGAGAGNTVIDANYLDRAFAVQSGARLTVNSVTVENGQTGYSTSSNSTAEDCGGAFYNDGILSVNASAVTNNSASDCGGAVYTDSSASATSFTNSTITGATAGDYVGALYVDSGSVSLSKTTITGTSSYYNGGIYTDTSSPTSISGSTISNTASYDEYGGALYLDGTGSLTVTNSTFASNNAGNDDGGAIYADGDRSSLKITGSTFADNSTDGYDGGAIYDDGSLLTVSGSTFSYNSAGDSDGGAIYTSGGDLSVSGSTFTGNEGYTGGALYVDGSTSTALQSITTSTFSGNQAASDTVGGGAIYDDNGNLQLTDSTLTGNSGYYGGGLYYISGDGLNLTNDTLDGNLGGGEGAGIYFDTSASTGTIELLNDTITRNTDYFGGGIAYPEDANSIANTIVAGNGGGYSSDGGGDCYDSAFLDNAGGADLGSNIDGDGTCFSTAASSFINTNPLLGQLSSNGGPTQTDSLPPSSPAVGQALSLPCPATDQRGWSRPLACDIGAFQTGGTAPVPPGQPFPLPPSVVTATPGNGQATVTWTPPPTNPQPGTTISSYTVTANPGGQGCTYQVSIPETDSCTVTGLTNGTAYEFSVASTNPFGTSGWGPPSASVIPAATPDAPTNVHATAGSLSAQVSWTAPADNGGRVITSYTVTSSPGHVTCTYVVMTPSTNTCTVTGLMAGNTYTFTVSATSGAGTGASSAPSNAVSFQATTSLKLTQSSRSSKHGKGVTFTAKVSDGGGTASGTVTFTVGGTVLGTVSLVGGVATLKVKTLPVGTDTVTATFNGSAALTTSWASVTHKVT
jgi:predicted outer membrane repeat protein